MKECIKINIEWEKQLLRFGVGKIVFKSIIKEKKKLESRQIEMTIMMNYISWHGI